jgi:prophage regulatory protein
MSTLDSNIYHLPEVGFVRLPQVLTVFPVGKTCWWDGVRAGRYPKPVKLSARCIAWRAEDIRQLIKNPLGWATEPEHPTHTDRRP